MIEMSGRSPNFC